VNPKIWCCRRISAFARIGLASDIVPCPKSAKKGEKSDMMMLFGMLRYRAFAFQFVIDGLEPVRLST
jgi:hypothetical protein